MKRKTKSIDIGPSFHVKSLLNLLGQETHSGLWAVHEGPVSCEPAVLFLGPTN